MAPVVRTPAQREAVAALEFLGDRRISTLAVAALCGYDIAELDDDAAGLVCLHPGNEPGPVPFQLYTQPARRNAIALAGDLDVASEALFIATLQRILPLLSDGTLWTSTRGSWNSSATANSSCLTGTAPRMAERRCCAVIYRPCTGCSS